MQMREKVGKSRNTMFFQWFGAPEGRKVGSLKRRVRSQLATWEIKNCTPLWHEARFQVKIYKAPQCWTTFWKLRCRKNARRCGAKHISKSKCKNTRGSDHFWKFRSRKSARHCGAKHIWKPKCIKMLKTPGVRTTFGSSDLEKVHAVVAQSTFGSQNVKNTRFSDHFWKFRSRKSARRCGAKHISKSKCTKHRSVGRLFGSSDLEKVHAVVARSTFWSQNVKNTRGSEHFFWRLRCRFPSLRFTTLLHYTTLRYTPLHHIPLH